MSSAIDAYDEQGQLPLDPKLVNTNIYQIIGQPLEDPPGDVDWIYGPVPIFNGTAGRPAYGSFAVDPENTIDFFNPIWSHTGDKIAMVGRRSGSNKISFWVCDGYTGISPLNINDAIGQNMRQVSIEFTHTKRQYDLDKPRGLTDEFFGDGELAFIGPAEYGGWGFPRPAWTLSGNFLLFQNITDYNELGRTGVYSIDINENLMSASFSIPQFEISSPSPSSLEDASSVYHGDLCPTVSPNGKWLLHGFNGSTSISSNNLSTDLEQSIAFPSEDSIYFPMPRETDFRLVRINGEVEVSPPLIKLEITNRSSEKSRPIAYTAFSSRKA
jgi:hypothetical protein